MWTDPWNLEKLSDAPAVRPTGMIPNDHTSPPLPSRSAFRRLSAFIVTFILLHASATVRAGQDNNLPASRPPNAPLVLTNIAGLVALAGTSPIPDATLRLDVICLYADVAWGSVWLSDATGTIWTGARDCPPWLQVGDRLRISGRNLPNRNEVDWTTAVVRHLATVQPPLARRFTATDLAQPHRGDVWADLEGIARHVHYQNQHAFIELIVGDRLVEITIPKVTSTDLARENSEVRCRGVLVPADRYSAPDCQHKLFCPNPGWVETTHPDLNRHFNVPILESPASILPGTNTPVRFRGRVARHERGRVELTETPLGTCLLESPLRTRLLPGLEIEAVGTLDPNSGGVPLLKHALYRVAPRPAAPTPAKTIPSPAAAVPLRTCAAVRAASGALAQQGLPVAIEAVVLADFTHLGWDVLFVEDATGATYVRSDTNVWNLSTGDRVAVEGLTETGEYGTNIRESRVHYLGPGTAPPPRRLTLGSLQLGSEESSWVDVLGWVRQAVIRDHVLHLELCDGTGNLTVYLGAGEVPLGMLDAIVRIRGVAAARFDSPGQLAGVALFCPSLDLVHIEEPALPSPFALPKSTLPELRHFTPNATPGLRRTRVTGIAIAQADPRSVFVQEDDRALLVHLSEVAHVTPAATVEAVGIPFWRGTTLELRHARIRETGTTQLPAPLTLPTPANFDPIHFGLRRSLDAELLSVTHFKNLIILGLDAGIPFDAVCDDRPENRSLLRLGPGCRLRLVGPVDPGDPAGEEHTSPRLFLASAADVEVLRRGPVWNARNALVFGGAVVALLLAGIVWVRSLRLQVRTRTTELQHELMERRQAEEALRGSLREKEVLLREIHHRVKNNLQIVSSLLSLQGLKVDNPSLRDALADTQGRVHSMALLHEALYRSGNLANLDVAEYVQTLVAHLRRALPAAAQRITFNLEVANVRLDIDRAVACGIIINELVTNSLKHAFPRQEPGSLAIRLQSITADRVMLEVEDDGVGIPPGLDPSTSGSLGLLLVSDLARQLGGTCEVKPAPGSCFHLEFPQSARS